MKHYIDQTEWWPVYLLQDSLGLPAWEVPDDLVARYEAALTEWHKVQGLLSEIRNQEQR